MVLLALESFYIRKTMAKKRTANFVETFFRQLKDFKILDLFDTIPEIQFWIKDVEGRYIKVNVGFLKNYMFLNDESIIGKTDFDLAPTYLAEQWVRDDKKVLAGVPISNRMELVGGYHQNILWHMTNKMPIYSDKGVVIGTSGTTRLIQNDQLVAGVFKELEEVIHFINDNFQKPIKNEDLAEMIFLSKSAFERKFKKIFKDSPQQYIKKLRINNACQLLLGTNESIVRIAIDCGLCDQSYLTKEFKQFLGKTPSEIRRGI